MNIFISFWTGTLCKTRLCKGHLQLHCHGLKLLQHSAECERSVFYSNRECDKQGCTLIHSSCYSVSMTILWSHNGSWICETRQVLLVDAKSKSLVWFAVSKDIIYWFSVVSWTLKSEFCGWENKQYFALLEIIKKIHHFFSPRHVEIPWDYLNWQDYKSTVMQLCEAVHRHGNALGWCCCQKLIRSHWWGMLILSRHNASNVHHPRGIC